MRRIQRAILCPFTITGWGVMSFTFIFLSLGVLKIFEASKLVLTGNFTCNIFVIRLIVDTLMERHILVDYKKVKTEVKVAVRYIVETRKKSPENVTGMKRNANEDQKTLEKFYDNQTLSKEKKIKLK